MSVLQHYYTSFVNAQTKSAGFQIKAMSPGISPETQALIARLINYRIPDIMNERDIQAHPVALRYYYHDMHECIFLCCQSNGNDESGRPGNFFAHTLVLEPEMFKTIPAVFFWQSSFWRNHDSETRAEMDVLPALPDLAEEAPSLDIEQVWSFLATQPNGYMRLLVSAVVHCHRTFRRVVIVDTSERVALWVAAISCLLPPDYRPLLSFATYHHDPRQSLFMITGTLGDSSFRNTAQDYSTYVVLNIETGQVSSMEPSPYADLVATITDAHDYEERLFPFFALIIRRFSHLLQLDDTLDMGAYFAHLDIFALYFKLIENRSARQLSPDELLAVEFALAGFEQVHAYDDDDIADLEALKDALDEIRPIEMSNSRFAQAYRRVEDILRTSGNFSQ